jgi:hypothetical protein
MNSVIIGDDTTGTLSVSVYHVDLITVWEIIIFIQSNSLCHILIDNIFNQIHCVIY